MYSDLILMDKNKEIEDFAKKLGISHLIFEEDFTKFGIFIAKDYTTNRKLIESKKIKVLVNPHLNPNKDSFHYRNGGLDHVICNLAHKNNVAIGFSLNSLDNYVLLGRFMQNIKLCRKYKVKMLFFTFAKNKYELRSGNDMVSFLRVFGMNGKEASDALKSLQIIAETS